MSDYRIIKVDARPEIDGVAALEAAVKAATAEGWQVAGGPFFHSAMMQYCQAMTRPAQPTARDLMGPGEVSLREHEQSDPHFPRVHSDPKDGPLKMRAPKP